VARALRAQQPLAGCAEAYAHKLLADLSFSPSPLRERAGVRAPEEHPAITWAHSGLMHLTGQPDGAPTMCPVPLAACADGALAALASLAGVDFGGLRGSQLLAERAAIAGYRRQGERSPGGHCRLLPAADGDLAVNLARDEDWSLIPAWLEADASDWNTLARIIRRRPAAQLEARARVLGLAVARSASPSAGAWITNDTSFPRRRESSSASKASGKLGPRLRGDDERPLVVDLSSLWAGPLCGWLLQRCGARVIKVESTQRPDGARHGPAAFFDLLNAGKESVALDLAAPAGRAQLRALLARADIVIEASRPRALRQLGIEAEALLAERPGLTWLSITGYGRSGPHENAIAYGDDAAVAAGLSEVLREATGQRLVAGDAIADPLTGLHAALAAWASYRDGGGRLVSLSLRDVVGHCIAFDLPPAGALKRRQAEWSRIGGEALAPTVRPARDIARPLGADTATVLAEFS